MKHLFIIIAIFLISTSQTFAQESRIPISVWIPNQIESLPQSASNNLKNRLSQIVTKSGVLGTGNNSRFIISANIDVLSKDVVATAPPMHAYTLEVTLYIGDGVEGVAFSSHYLTVKGVGRSETKAYMDAIGNIKSNNSKYNDFIDEARKKIIQYYNQQCDLIIKEAQTLAQMSKFDEAIWKLTAIPTACGECWSKALDALAPIYQMKVDYECKEHLSRATAIWDASQNRTGASQAGAELTKISPNSSCFAEADALRARIAQRILEIDNREWEFNWEKSIELERDRIKAYRDIGVAYGEGQQPITYRSLW